MSTTYSDDPFYPTYFPPPPTETDLTTGGHNPTTTQAFNYYFLIVAAASMSLLPSSPSPVSLLSPKSILGHKTHKAKTLKLRESHH